MDPTPYTLILFLIGAEAPVLRDGYTYPTCTDAGRMITTRQYDKTSGKKPKYVYCWPTPVVKQLESIGYFRELQARYTSD